MTTFFCSNKYEIFDFNTRFYVVLFGNLMKREIKNRNEIISILKIISMK